MAGLILPRSPDRPLKKIERHRVLVVVEVGGIGLLFLRLSLLLLESLFRFFSFLSFFPSSSKFVFQSLFQHLHHLLSSSFPHLPSFFLVFFLFFLSSSSSFIRIIVIHRFDIAVIVISVGKILTSSVSDLTAASGSHVRFQKIHCAGVAQLVMQLLPLLPLLPPLQPRMIIELLLMRPLLLLRLRPLPLELRP
jgi:hypothetical protein